jgi:hypothetical protein
MEPTRACEFSSFRGAERYHILGEYSLTTLRQEPLRLQSKHPKSGMEPLGSVQLMIEADVCTRVDVVLSLSVLDAMPRGCFSGWPDVIGVVTRHVLLSVPISYMSTLIKSYILK